MQSTLPERSTNPPKRASIRDRFDQWKSEGISQIQFGRVLILVSVVLVLHSPIIGLSGAVSVDGSSGSVAGPSETFQSHPTIERQSTILADRNNSADDRSLFGETFIIIGHTVEETFGILKNTTKSTVGVLNNTTDGTLRLVNTTTGETIGLLDSTADGTFRLVNTTTGKTIGLLNSTTDGKLRVLNNTTGKTIGLVNSTSNGTLRLVNTTTGETISLVNNTADRSFQLANNTTGKTIGLVNSTSDGTLQLVNNTTRRTISQVNNTSDGRPGIVNSTVGETLQLVKNTADGTLRLLNNTTGETIGLVNNTADGTLQLVNNTTDKTLRLVNNTTDRTLQLVNNTTGETIGIVNNTVDETTGLADSRDDEPTTTQTTTHEETPTSTPTETESRSTEQTETTTIRRETTPRNETETTVETQRGTENLNASATGGGSPIPVPSPETAGTLSILAIGAATAVRHGSTIVGAINSPSVSLARTSTGLRSGTLSSARTRIGAHITDLITHTLALFRYSRYDDSDPLEHKGREDLFNTIQETPGIHLSAVEQRTDLSLSSIRHHLRVLEQESLVMGVKVRGKRRIYPKYSDEVELVAALNDEPTQKVIDALRRLGPSSVTVLAMDLDLDPSTVTHHCQRLADDGIVVRERDGRTMMNRLSSDAKALVTDGGFEFGQPRGSQQTGAD